MILFFTFEGCCEVLGFVHVPFYFALCSSPLHPFHQPPLLVPYLLPNILLLYVIVSHEKRKQYGHKINVKMQFS